MFYSHPYDTAARPNVTPNAQMCPGAQHRHPREDLIAAPRTDHPAATPTHISRGRTADCHQRRDFATGLMPATWWRRRGRAPRLRRPPGPTRRSDGVDEHGDLRELLRFERPEPDLAALEVDRQSRAVNSAVDHQGGVVSHRAFPIRSEDLEHAAVERCQPVVDGRFDDIAHERAAKSSAQA